MSEFAGCDYTLFGLRVRSALELPELFPADTQGEPDIWIDREPIGNSDGKPGLTPVKDGLLLTVPDVARFLVSNGRRISVEHLPGVDPRNVRLFLLGSAFGALLHQRGLLPLHANAVEVDGRAFAFMGESGAGKSTLAAWFHDRGYRVLADDVCVVTFDSGIPIASRGIARLRLWRDALEASGRQPNDHVRSAMLDAEKDKFDLTIAIDGVAPPHSPLAAVYMLDRAEQFSITRMRGIEAAEALFANTYRGTYIEDAGTAEIHFRTCVRLAQSIPTYRLGRAWGLKEMDRQNALIMSHVRDVEGKMMPAAES